MKITFVLHHGGGADILSETVSGINTPHVIRVVDFPLPVITPSEDEKVVSVCSDHLLRVDKQERLNHVRDLAKEMGDKHLYIKLEDFLEDPDACISLLERFCKTDLTGCKTPAWEELFQAVNLHEQDRRTNSIRKNDYVRPVEGLPTTSKAVKLKPMTSIHTPGFKPEEKTPLPVVKRKRPNKILILCQDDLTPKLRGTLFSFTGKSLKTAGRNPLVIRAKELSAVARSAKPVGCIEIPADKLDEWDAPDILDDFYVVVFSDKEIPLPSCEGDANLFTFQPEDLKDLAPLYAFLSLEM